MTALSTPEEKKVFGAGFALIKWLVEALISSVVWGEIDGDCISRGQIICVGNLVIAC